MTFLERLQNNRNALGLLFMLPAGVLLLLFLTYPLGLGTWLGFTDTKVGRPGEWVGFENYTYLWGDAVVRRGLTSMGRNHEVLVAAPPDAPEVVAGTDFTAVDLWEVNATKGSCLLYYAPEAPAIDVPAAGYTFVWKGDEGQQDEVVESDVYRQVRRWWDSERKSWMIEAAESFDCKITSADAGMLFYDTILT